MQTKHLRIGLVGSGFMGRSHTFGFNAVSGVFGLPLVPKLEMLADASDELAATAAASRCGASWTSGSGREAIPC